MHPFTATVSIADFLPLARRMPLLDTRSPSEYRHGHIPGALSFPLFSDAERAAVGTLYTQQGREAAVLQGLSFVGPRLASMAEQALALVGPGREAAVYCWRGGMRSASVAWLLEQAGIKVYRLERGYKAYRGHARELFTRPWPLLALGGMTGSGKTEALQALEKTGSQVIDLEGLAMHRGSVFGALPGHEALTTEQFENLLEEQLRHLDPARPVWVEDECRNLGGVNIPMELYEALRAAPLIVLNTPREDRTRRVVALYDPAHNAFAAEGLRRIEKRLGSENLRRALAALEAEQYGEVVAILLDYYDRAYAKQLRLRPAPAGSVDAAPGERMDTVAERLRAFETPPRG